MKRWICIVLCLLSLTGCTVISESEPYSPAGTGTGQPDSETVNLEEKGRILKPALYFLNAENRLVAEMRSVAVKQGHNPAEVAVRELLRGPEGQDLNPVAPDGVTLDSVQTAENVANVYLSGTPGNMAQYDIFVLKYAITNTITDLMAIGYVNVYFGGMETDLESHPYGTIEKFTGDILEAYNEKRLHYVAEIPETLDPDGAEQPEELRETTETFETTLYFISAGGNYILPEVRKVTYENGDYLTGLIAELKKGPKDTGAMQSCVPGDIEFLSEPVFASDADGTSRVRLNFSKRPTLFPYEDIENETLSYAAVVYSLTGFIPGLLSVDIHVAGTPVSADVFPDGMKRSDFMELMGGSIDIYFPLSDSSMLLKVTRSVEQQDVWDARVRLAELIKGPTADENPSAWPAIPAGITADDISDVYLNQDTLNLNLSRNFADRCRDLSPDGEMSLVYAITNTLVEMDGVKKVQFLIEGKRAETLAGSLYIYNPFLRNPGLIKEE